MKKRLFSLLLLLVLLTFTVTPVFAQDYLFQVTQAEANFFVNKDGTASVRYILTFKNNPSGHIIDYIDIGMPSPDYDLGSITADVDGKKITDITVSTYIPQGITLGLGSDAIPEGGTGTVTMWVPVIRKVIFPSTDKPDYASVQFMPNYFGRQYVEGDTDWSVTIILPPGLTKDEPVYYPPSSNWPGSKEPTSNFDQDQRIFYTWEAKNANSYSEYVFGAGFPNKVIPTTSVVTKQEPIAPAAPVKNSGGGGSSGFNFDPTCLCVPGFFGLIAAIIGLSAYGASKRKFQYLPPKISIEGHGIKRGLTAVEVAILMEQPMDKVLTMILFSTVKKGAARVTSRDPLKIQVADPLPQGLYPYETDFLEAFKVDDKAPARRKKLQDVMVGLVKSITEKMRGFSRKETLAYYNSILEEAWKQVQEAQTPEVKSQKYEEVSDWTMLDRNYPQRTRDTFGTGPIFIPMWWGSWDPGYHGAGGLGTGGVRPASSGGGTVGGGGLSRPTLPGADFAASMVNGVQTFAAGVIGDVGAFTGAVTNQTNPPPPPSRSTYRGGGGGGGCACACACAGCACACAGGGR